MGVGTEPWATIFRRSQNLRNLRSLILILILILVLVLVLVLILTLVLVLILVLVLVLVPGSQNLRISENLRIPRDLSTSISISAPQNLRIPGSQNLRESENPKGSQYHHQYLRTPESQNSLLWG